MMLTAGRAPPTAVRKPGPSVTTGRPIQSESERALCGPLVGLKDRAEKDRVVIAAKNASAVGPSRT